jgi:FkbH-like protein
MKLIDALRTINAARQGDRPVERYYLACGFTPLHLATFATARLQERAATTRVEVAVGQFGDLPGNIARAAAAQPSGVLVAVEWSDLDARLGARVAGGWSPGALDDVLATVRATFDRVGRAIGQAAQHAPVAVCGPTLPVPPAAHTPGPLASHFELTLCAALATWMRELADVPRVRLVSPQRVDMLSPLAERADVKAELATGFPYTQPHAARIAELLADVLRPAAPKKGLITDLDDTFWRGILGDAGVDGVHWSHDQGSQVHALYQQLLDSLADAGVLVAVASKNDEAIVRQAFARSDLRAKADRLFPVQAHWRAKSESVTQILRAWNVGADAVVFVDDSPMELAEVQAQHPGVECIRFPKDDPAEVMALLVRLRDLFGKPALLAEDRLRGESIRANAALQEAVAEGGDAEAFLASARATVTLDFRKRADDQRAFELVNKTNQYNLNGRRITEAEWMAAVEDPSAFVLTVDYADKFGALGRIAVAVGRVEGDTAHVTSWVMSCRAFARRVEHRTLQALFERFGVEAVTLDFAPTERNGPTREFLAELVELPDTPATLRIARDDLTSRLRPLYHAVQYADEEFTHA